MRRGRSRFTARHREWYGNRVNYFRSMSPANDGLPQLGRRARNLGVRVPIDIAPDASGDVLPTTGGLSVSPSAMQLPPYRRPRGFDPAAIGPRGDRVYSVSEGICHAQELLIRRDTEDHALVEPRVQMSLYAYEAALNATRPDWKQVFP